MVCNICVVRLFCCLVDSVRERRVFFERRRRRREFIDLLLSIVVCLVCSLFYILFFDNCECNILCSRI